MNPTSLMTPDPEKPQAPSKHEPFHAAVIDGGGLAVTAWTANRTLETPEARVKGAIYIFATALASISRMIRPGCPVIVAWDGDDNRKWRRGFHPWYKHGRGSLVNREEIRVVTSQLDALLKAMGVIVFKVNGREADDVVATVVRMLVERDGRDVLIFSDDKDYLQLVRPGVALNRRSFNGMLVTHDNAAVHGIAIGAECLYEKAMIGDSGDNIRGLKQIGEAKARAALAINSRLVEQCLENPTDVDWSQFEGSLRRAFVKAGRRLVWPPQIEDLKFVKEFVRRRKLNVSPSDAELGDDECLIATAAEIANMFHLVEMDDHMDDQHNFDLTRPKPNLEAIPVILRRLELDDETDIYSSLYRIAGMVSPGVNPPWRAASRASDIDPITDDKF